MPARILVVEDDQDLHLGLALRLQAAGHEVCSALHGAEAVEVAKERKPDVLLLDVGLPGFNGHEVARRLSVDPETRDIPIIYLTARHEPTHRVRAAERGAAAYLVKPAEPARLFAAIDAALISRRVRTEL